MDISGFMVNYWYIILGLVGGSVYVFMTWKKTPSGSVKWDSISFKIPLFGPIIRMVAIARFTRTLSTLLTGGVPMLMAMDIVKNVVDNHIISDAIDDARSNISEGESISGPLKKSGQFPSIVIDMVSIGEKTGELENMLAQVSDAYDFQVKAKIETMTALVTPLVTVIMGIVVFIIVISIMMPMFEMTDIGN
jgi:general secretion pathway protein F